METRLNDEQETTKSTSCLCLGIYNWWILINKEIE